MLDFLKVFSRFFQGLATFWVMIAILYYIILQLFLEANIGCLAKYGGFAPYHLCALCEKTKLTRKFRNDSSENRGKKLCAKSSCSQSKSTYLKKKRLGTGCLLKKVFYSAIHPSHLNNSSICSSSVPRRCVATLPFTTGLCLSSRFSQALFFTKLGSFFAKQNRSLTASIWSTAVALEGAWSRSPR